MKYRYIRPMGVITRHPSYTWEVSRFARVLDRLRLRGLALWLWRHRRTRRLIARTKFTPGEFRMEWRTVSEWEGPEPGGAT